MRSCRHLGDHFLPTAATGMHASSARASSRRFGGAMDLGIVGRKALLSGASRGLGKGCALALAREGAEITIVARKRDSLEQTAEELRKAGAKVTGVVGDITTPDGRAAALEACPAPDILVNNADGRLPGDFRNWTREDWI